MSKTRKRCAEWFEKELMRNKAHMNHHMKVKKQKSILDDQEEYNPNHRKLK